MDPVNAHNNFIRTSLRSTATTFENFKLLGRFGFLDCQTIRIKFSAIFLVKILIILTLL